MHFRPALWMTIIAIPSLVMLLYLGTWQVMRMYWKGGLIAEFSERATRNPVPPPVIDDATAMRYQRLEVKGTWLHDSEVQLTGRTFEGTAGYHVITPMRLTDGRILIINRGWVSQDYRRPASRPSSLAEGQVIIDAILRLPAQKGYFVPENDSKDDDWFTLNIDDIKRHHNLGKDVITAYTADVLRPNGPYVLPIGALAKVDIPNDHWHYALTWYGIALGLVGVYMTWHIQAGRLRFRR